MSDKPLYYIEVFNSQTNSKGFVVEAGEGIAITEYPIPAMMFFDTPEDAQQCVVDKGIETEYTKAYVKEQGDLIAEGTITVISVMGWYLQNDDGWKLCYDHLKNLYYWDKCEAGYLVWLDKKIAERALIKFTKQFNKMPMFLHELSPIFN